MRSVCSQVKRYVNVRLEEIKNHPRDSAGKAILARLRRGAGRSPGEIPELWEVFLRGLPTELQGLEEPSYAEWAIYTALTLFALHQQGHPLESEFMDQSEMTLGKAMRCLVQKMDGDLESREERVRNRLNRTAASTDILELSVQLRGIVKLLGDYSIKLDYPRLAEDLYWYQFQNDRNNIRLRWGQDYYKMQEETI